MTKIILATSLYKVKKGEKRIILKDYRYLDKFADKLVKEVEDMVTENRLKKLFSSLKK